MLARLGRGYLVRHKKPRSKGTFVVATRRVLGRSLLAVAALITVVAVPDVASAAPQSVYVDCSASVNGDGSANFPLNSMPNANKVTLGPGDQLLFKRGTTCNGQLW